MTPWQRIRAARTALNHFREYAGPLDIWPSKAVEAVARGMNTTDYTSFTPATDQDVANAAILLDEAREDVLRNLDYTELLILDGLTARGWTNKQIGEHLGYNPQNAAAQAANRIKRLHRKFPSFERPATTPETTQRAEQA